ncbi:MAG: hypothetical protein PHH71_01590 [Clostridia bacterium]|jgi:hypothetical protein|nr:hypothetical protein [Clostridia bacterium]MDD3862458.1 hypothetical protein [Clostridia bacterium]MDD4408399.1 hypothetical protein [Clostridia bacterium]
MNTKNCFIKIFIFGLIIFLSFLLSFSLFFSKPYDFKITYVDMISTVQNSSEFSSGEFSNNTFFNGGSGELASGTSEFSSGIYGTKFLSGSSISENGIIITPRTPYAYCYIYDTYIDNGAYAFYTNGDGDTEVLEVETIGEINTSKVGVQILKYKAINSLNEVAVFEKNVEVLYPPVSDFSIKCLTSSVENNTYVDFQISNVSIDNGGIVNPYQIFTIRCDGRFVKEISSRLFYIPIYQQGRTQVSVETSGKNINGDLIKLEQKMYIDVNEVNWWKYLDTPLIPAMIILMSPIIAYLLILFTYTPSKNFTYSAKQSAREKNQKFKNSSFSFRISRLYEKIKNKFKKK